MGSTDSITWSPFLVQVQNCKRRKMRWRKPQLVKWPHHKGVNTSVANMKTSCHDHIKTTELIAASWLQHSGRRNQSMSQKPPAVSPKLKSVKHQCHEERMVHSYQDWTQPGSTLTGGGISPIPPHASGEEQTMDHELVPCGAWRRISTHPCSR